MRKILITFLFLSCINCGQDVCNLPDTLCLTSEFDRDTVMQLLSITEETWMDRLGVYLNYDNLFKRYPVYVETVPPNPYTYGMYYKESDRIEIDSTLQCNNSFVGSDCNIILVHEFLHYAEYHVLHRVSNGIHDMDIFHSVDGVLGLTRDKIIEKNICVWKE